MTIFNLVSTREENSLNPGYLEELVSIKFNTKTHISAIEDLNPKTDVLLWGLPWKITDQIKQFLDSGGRCIFDALWEYHLYNKQLISFISNYKETIIALTAADTKEFYNLPNTISIPNWFWYNESLWYRNRGYHDYIPNDTNKIKKFLMPMRRLNNHRQKLFNSIQLELPNAIWSFVELGISLPEYSNDIHDQRYFNSNWYDQTFFSLVAETEVNYEMLSIITEKTFKPIAFNHPFIILGQPKILTNLQNMGFATFPEIFNEDYDLEFNLEKRICMIIDEVKNFNPELIKLTSVQEKLQHNHNLFFNNKLVTDRINSELLEPLYNWLSK